MSTILVPSSASDRPPAPEPTFVIRLRKRGGFERMDPRHPEPAAFEIGWTTRTDPYEWRAPTKQEFGQMVAVNLSDPRLVYEAMHSAADLWAREVRKQPSLRRGRGASDKVVARMTIGRSVGRVEMEFDRVADEVHRLADRWEQEKRDHYLAWLATQPVAGNA